MPLRGNHGAAGDNIDAFHCAKCAETRYPLIAPLGPPHGLEVVLALVVADHIG